MRYFVSYHWSGDQGVMGHGNVEITPTKAIEGQDEIRAIEKYLRERIDAASVVVVLNWQRFEGGE